MDRLVSYQSTFGTTWVLPYSTSPKTLQQCVGLEFSEFMAHLLPDRCSSKSCRVSYSRDKSLHVSIILSTKRAPLTDVGEEKRDRCPVISHDIWWGCAGPLGGALEICIIVPPTRKQIDLSYQKPELVIDFSMNLLEDGALLQRHILLKHQGKTITLQIMKLKNVPMAKDLMRVSCTLGKGKT